MGDYNEKIILYTWHDVERELFLDKANWPDNWINIEVYSTEIIIYLDSLENNSMQNTEKYLIKFFKLYYKDNSIIIPETNTQLSITYEKSEDKRRIAKPFPLFKDFLYVKSAVSTEIAELKGVPVTAFHSYKGGVGRTLSLITFVRDMIAEFGDKKKVLIIDSDLEAPGLTWLGKQQENKFSISYIDILSIIAAKGDSDEIIEKLAKTVQESTLTFHTEKMEISQFFLPTYRKEDQLMDLFANPERIMSGESNKYIIIDVLSKLGSALNVDMVLVDLRAGISEYSAPFLFDKRVNKFIVSSTSYQSICGTNLLLKQLEKQKGNGITNILLTMVMKETFTEAKRNEIYQMLLQTHIAESGDMESDIQSIDTIIEVEKNDAMIQLGSLNNICDRLNVSGNITEPLMDVVKEMFRTDNEVLSNSMEQVKQFRNELNAIAEDNVTAENININDMLTTKPVIQLGRFTNELPKINILGAKGSGKTYIYKQLVATKSWQMFLSILSRKFEGDDEILICPILCSEDRSKWHSIINECQQNCVDKMPYLKRENYKLTDNHNLVKEAMQQNISEKEWKTFWQSMIFNLFEGISTWEELDGYLKTINKKVIFIFDGLENIFTNVSKSDTERNGIQTLCKDYINHLYDAQTNNIGSIIFLRKDIAQLAIDVNFAQFQSQYQQYELQWSQKDALQLALKIIAKAASQCNICILDENISIQNASLQVIEDSLTKVWGKKMGSDKSKTAGTTRWVLASLSDFTGQLQARDIVRFLKYASKEELGKKLPYSDRLLFPDDMRQAIKHCSEEKLKEVEAEIQQLKNVFQKLKDVSIKDKQIPLNSEVMDVLTDDDKKTLRLNGYLKEADGEFYIPEGIRYALGYNKSKRGGIKLVSLLVNR